MLACCHKLCLLQAHTQKKFQGGHSCRGAALSAQEGGMLLPQGTILPSGSGITPSEGSFLPYEGGMPPWKSDNLPSEGSIMPIVGCVMC